MIKTYLFLILLFCLSGSTSIAQIKKTASKHVPENYITSHDSLSMADFSNSIYAFGVEKCWPDTLINGWYSGSFRDVYEKPIYYDITISLQRKKNNLTGSYMFFFQGPDSEMRIKGSLRGTAKKDGSVHWIMPIALDTLGKDSLKSELEFTGKCYQYSYKGWSGRDLCMIAGIVEDKQLKFLTVGTLFLKLDDGLY